MIIEKERVGKIVKTNPNWRKQLKWFRFRKQSLSKEQLNGYEEMWSNGIVDVSVKVGGEYAAIGKGIDHEIVKIAQFPTTMKSVNWLLFWTIVSVGTSILVIIFSEGRSKI